MKINGHFGTVLLSALRHSQNDVSPSISSRCESLLSTNHVGSVIWFTFDLLEYMLRP